MARYYLRLEDMPNWIFTLAITMSHWLASVVLLDLVQIVTIA